MATPSGPSNFEDHTSSSTPGTPGTPGSDESAVPEEYYILRDIICPKLRVLHTSALQGEGWVAEIMTTPHIDRFYDNIRMIKPCFYALVEALTSRGLLPQGQSSRVSSFEELNGCVAMAYRRYLDSAGFEQMEGWSFEVEQRFMFLILDDNTHVPMCNDDAAELAMERWTRALRRHFRRRFTISERFSMAPRYFVYTEPAYNNMLEIWGGGRRDNQFVPEESSNEPQLQQPAEGRHRGPDTPIVISESNTSVRDSRHFAGSWDPHLRSGVGDVGSWSDYIRRFAVGPHDGTPHASEGDSTVRSRPRRARPPRDDVAD
ncbi:hypothetical protein Salat_1869300 [Sesamum alatum]|uniref:Uncharacterized protein n=1 Tax=Sesamum alatum TaxID=300844 RepID=A0AAE2CI01_9LAMI|nr:hypothetical protein Salat_1869300 [Sesamum alatum]